MQSKRFKHEINDPSALLSGTEIIPTHIDQTDVTLVESMISNLQRNLLVNGKSLVSELNDISLACDMVRNKIAKQLTSLDATHSHNANLEPLLDRLAQAKNQQEVDDIYITLVLELLDKHLGGVGLGRIACEYLDQGTFGFLDKVLVEAIIKPLQENSDRDTTYFLDQTKCQKNKKQSLGKINLSFDPAEKSLKLYNIIPSYNISGIKEDIVTGEKSLKTNSLAPSFDIVKIKKNTLHKDPVIGQLTGTTEYVAELKLSDAAELKPSGAGELKPAEGVKGFKVLNIHTNNDFIFAAIKHGYKISDKETLVQHLSLPKKYRLDRQQLTSSNNEELQRFYSNPLAKDVKTGIEPGYKYFCSVAKAKPEIFSFEGETIQFNQNSIESNVRAYFQDRTKWIMNTFPLYENLFNNILSEVMSGSGYQAHCRDFKLNFYTESDGSTYLQVVATELLISDANTKSVVGKLSSESNMLFEINGSNYDLINVSSDIKIVKHAIKQPEKELSWEKIEKEEGYQQVQSNESTLNQAAPTSRIFVRPANINVVKKKIDIEEVSTDEDSDEDDTDSLTEEDEDNVKKEAKLKDDTQVASNNEISQYQKIYNQVYDLGLEQTRKEGELRRYNVFAAPAKLIMWVADKVFDKKLDWTFDSDGYERFKAFMGFPRQGNPLNIVAYALCGFIFTPAKNILKLVEFGLKVLEDVADRVFVNGDWITTRLV